MAAAPGPAALQLIASHAERLAALLFVYELTPPTGDAPARRWLHGRSAEVERYVESVLDDRASGALDEGAAVAALEAYLEGLHVGLVAHLGVTEPSCCHPRPGRRKGGRRQ